jgi:hypothetical protein
MELQLMLPIRQFAMIAVLAALLAAARTEPVVAAFGITSVTGAVQLPGGPPPNVFPGVTEGALPIVYTEVLNGTIVPTGAHPAGMDVDHDGSNVIASPTVSGNVVNPALVSTTIPVGTKFNSFMFHFDPLGAPFFAFYLTTVNFDDPIIGVQLFSDGFLLNKPAGTGYIGTQEQGDVQVAFNGGPALGYYPGSVPFRGVEEDSFVLAIAGNKMTVAGSAHGVEIDEVRVITAAPVQTGVPEPTTAATWAIVAAIGCCVAFIRQKQKKC